MLANAKYVKTNKLKDYYIKQYDYYYYNNYKPTIYHAYQKPSYSKLKAYNEIKQDYYNNKGYQFTLLGHNSSFFTCGYLIDIEDKTYLIIETYCNTYKILYD